MSAYTAYMVALAAFTASLHLWVRDGVSAALIMVSCIPFFAIPGLSDARYLPIEPNSPIAGGALALVIGLVVIRFAAQPWHVLIACILGGFMILAGLRVVGVFSPYLYAVSLEFVFVCIMLLGITARFVDIDYPAPDAVRKALLWQRDGSGGF